MSNSDFCLTPSTNGKGTIPAPCNPTTENDGRNTIQLLETNVEPSPVASVAESGRFEALRFAEPLQCDLHWLAAAYDLEITRLHSILRSPISESDRSVAQAQLDFYQEQIQKNAAADIRDIAAGLLRQKAQRRLADLVLVATSIRSLKRDRAGIRRIEKIETQIDQLRCEVYGLGA